MHTRIRVLAAAGGLALALPASAQAATKTVDMGLPPASAKTFNQKYQSDANDFFPHGVTIHVGDSVKFMPVGFHSVDLPKKGGRPLGLIAPTGQKVAGAADAAGVPFWFNGKDQLAFARPLLNFTFGKTLTYDGSKDVRSGLPVQGRPKPLLVKFTKAGSFTYYCNIHSGMKGVVRVVARSKRIPSAKANASTVKRQLARALSTAKKLAATKAPPGVIDVGSAGAHGVERYAFFPDTLTVPTGATVRFRLTPGSTEDHTATSGPGDPEREPGSYLGRLAKSFQSPSPDATGAYPSGPFGTIGTLDPTAHGNGFWNSGVLDTAIATPQQAANTVTFTAPGTYQFYCLIHPFMHATVKVQ